MIDLATRARAIEALAALVRAGLPLREALVRWHERAPTEVRPPMIRLARRVRLGDRIHAAVTSLDAFDDDAPVLANLIDMQVRLGGDVAEMLDAFARTLHERDAARAAAAAAVSGVRLSGRLIAALPLAFIPLTSAGDARWDVTALVLAVGGIALSLCGLLWMSRLMPRPPRQDDPASAAADQLACALTGGSSLHGALATLACAPPVGVEEALGRARRMVALGTSWSTALARQEDPALRSLGRQIVDAEAFGIPLAEALRSFARNRRTSARIEFERKTRRATVLMVLPLTLCVLPAFVLLGVVPLLRSLSWG